MPRCWLFSPGNLNVSTLPVRERKKKEERRLVACAVTILYCTNKSYGINKIMHVALRLVINLHTCACVCITTTKHNSL